MVDFTLTDEQKAVREMAHDFAVKEIRPVAWEFDKEGTWPDGVLRKAWEVGLMNTHIPEEYGGPGASYLDGTLITKEGLEPLKDLPLQTLSYSDTKAAAGGVDGFRKRSGSR